MMARRRKTLSIDVERLFAADAGLRKQSEMWRADGYLCTGGHVWRCRDGSFTARIVWRNRAAVVSTITCTVRGLAL